MPIATICSSVCPSVMLPCATDLLPALHKSPGWYYFRLNSTYYLNYHHYYIHTYYWELSHCHPSPLRVDLMLLRSQQRVNTRCTSQEGTQEGTACVVSTLVTAKFNQNKKKYGQSTYYYLITWFRIHRDACRLIQRARCPHLTALALFQVSCASKSYTLYYHYYY